MAISLSGVAALLTIPATTLGASIPLIRDHTALKRLGVLTGILNKGSFTRSEKALLAKARQPLLIRVSRRELQPSAERTRILGSLLAFTAVEWCVFLFFPAHALANGKGSIVDTIALGALLPVAIALALLSIRFFMADHKMKKQWECNKRK